MEELATGRRARGGAQLSSGWLALALAVSYLVVSATIGISLLVRPEVVSAGGPAGPPARVLVEGGPDGTARSTAGRGVSGVVGASREIRTPPGFRRVSGPGGIRTVIPAGWPVSRSTGPGAMQAIDPADGTRVVKFGGAPAPRVDIATSHIRYERLLEARTPGYRRLSLASATYGGHAAVEWEFERGVGGGRERVRSLYWRTQGIEYFVLASAPASGWARMKPIYDVLVANSRP